LTSASRWASGLHRGTASVLGRRAHIPNLHRPPQHTVQQRQSAPQSSLHGIHNCRVCLIPKWPSPGQRVVVTRATWNINDWPSPLRWQLSDLHPSIADAGDQTCCILSGRAGDLLSRSSGQRYMSRGRRLGGQSGSVRIAPASVVFQPPLSCPTQAQVHVPPSDPSRHDTTRPC
jgi:hypothetical protein